MRRERERRVAEVDAQAIMNNTGRSRTLTSNQSLKRTIPSTFGPENVETWASTEVEQETFAFLWTLKNYSALYVAGNEEIKSPIFYGGPRSLHSWQLKMNPKKKMEEQELFAVHLIINGFGDSDSDTPRGASPRIVKVRFQISLLDLEGRPESKRVIVIALLLWCGSPGMKDCAFKRLNAWGYDKLLASSNVISPADRLVDTLMIHCRIWIEGELKHKSGQGGAVPENLTEDEVKKQPHELLSDNFKDLLQDTSFADVGLSTDTKYQDIGTQQGSACR